VKDILNTHIVKEWVITKRIFTLLHDFPNKIVNISKYEVVEPKFSDEEYQEYMKLKSNNSTIIYNLHFTMCGESKSMDN